MGTIINHDIWVYDCEDIEPTIKINDDNYRLSLRVGNGSSICLFSKDPSNKGLRKMVVQFEERLDAELDRFLKGGK